MGYLRDQRQYGYIEITAPIGQARCRPCGRNDYQNYGPSVTDQLWLTDLETRVDQYLLTPPGSAEAASQLEGLFYAWRAVTNDSSAATG